MAAMKRRRRQTICRKLAERGGRRRRGLSCGARTSDASGSASWIERWPGKEWNLDPRNTTTQTCQGSETVQQCYRVFLGSVADSGGNVSVLHHTRRVGAREWLDRRRADGARCRDFRRFGGTTRRCGEGLRGNRLEARSRAVRRQGEYRPGSGECRRSAARRRRDCRDSR